MMAKDKTQARSDRRKARYEKISNVNKERVITYLAYLMIIAIIILSSSLQVIFDFANFNLARFITNIAFSFAIAIFAMLFSVKDGKNSNEWSKRGFLFEAKEAFNTARKKVVDTNIFRQFADVLYNRERNSFIATQISAVGIYDISILQASIDDINALVKEPKICALENGKKKPFDQITRLQADTILKYKRGQFVFNKIEYTFFLSRTQGNDYKRNADAGDKEQALTVWSIVYRLALILISSAIFAMAMVNPLETSGTQVAFDMASRLFTFASSAFFGYSLANDISHLRAETLLYKVDIIDEYIVEKESGTFIPIDIEQTILLKIAKIEASRAAVNIQAATTDDVVITTDTAPANEGEFEITDDEIKLLEEHRKIQQ